jgi:hypothetical protein
MNNYSTIAVIATILSFVLISLIILKSKEKFENPDFIRKNRKYSPVPSILFDLY